MRGDSPPDDHPGVGIDEEARTPYRSEGLNSELWGGDLILLKLLPACERPISNRKSRIRAPETHGKALACNAAMFARQRLPTSSGAKVVLSAAINELERSDLAVQRLTV